MKKSNNPAFSERPAPKFITTRTDTLIYQICVVYGFCGSIQDDISVNVRDLLPKTGEITAEQFAEFALLADGVAPDFSPTKRLRWKENLTQAFLEIIGAPAISAEELNGNA